MTSSTTPDTAASNGGTTAPNASGVPEYVSPPGFVGGYDALASGMIIV
jgi:hypothetical protein